MPTVTKTWTFTSDTEGLVDVGDSANLAWAFDAGTIDCVGVQGAYTNSERARRAATGQTWETWGVPAGAVVTDVQITAWQERQWSGVGTITSHSIKMRVVDTAGASVHSAGDLINQALTNSVDASWQTGAAPGTSRAVDAGKQASTTDVRLELEYALTRPNAAGASDQGFDTIVLTITYTAGGGTQLVVTRRVAYDVQAQLAVTRRVAYDIQAQVIATRRVAYDVLAQLLVTRRLAYDLLAALLVTRRVAYDIGGVVLVTRRVSYDVVAVLVVTRGIVYDLGVLVVPPGAVRQGLWYW